jgi:anti-anti-sigma factor
VTGASHGPTLNVSVARTGSTVVVRLQGELDVATANHLDQVLRDLLTAADRPQRIVVDAEELAFLDASGLHPLLAVRRQLGDGSLRLRHARPPVLRVLRLLDLAAVFGLDA